MSTRKTPLELAAQIKSGGGFSQGDILYLIGFIFAFQKCNCSCKFGNKLPNGKYGYCAFLHHSKGELDNIFYDLVNDELPESKRRELVKILEDACILLGWNKNDWKGTHEVQSKILLKNDSDNESTVTTKPNNLNLSLTSSNNTRRVTSNKSFSDAAKLQNDDSDIVIARILEESKNSPEGRECLELDKAIKASICQQNDANAFTPQQNERMSCSPSPLTVTTTATTTTLPNRLCPPGTLVGKKNGGDGDLVAIPLNNMINNCIFMTICGYHDVRMLGVNETAYF